MKTKTITLDQFITRNYGMEQELYTIQLTRRELGLLKHYSRKLFANIDDDVTSDGGSCTGSHPIEKDWYGKDAITNLYRKAKTITDTHYNLSLIHI